MPLSIVDIMNFTNYFSVLSLKKSDIGLIFLLIDVEVKVYNHPSVSRFY